jgi:xanthine dehydrogenase accessory factor
MKEIESIVNAYHKIDFSATRASLATVVRVEGSSYRRMGARMLVLDNGTYLGGISGGCLEGDALRRAQKAIANGKPSIVTYDTTKDDGQQIGVGLGCNGIIDVLFTPLDSKDENNPVLMLASLVTTRAPRILVTIADAPTHLGQTVLFDNEAQFLEKFPLQKIKNAVLEKIKHVAQTNTSLSVSLEEDTLRVFVECLVPATHLVVYGGNYDIYSVVQLARNLGWNVTVVMNVHKADKSLFALGASVLHNKGSEAPLIDAFTALILMAHDYKTDLENLQKVLPSPTRYIGLLGPKKRSQKMFDALNDAGTPISELNKNRIFAPAGLDIGAQTPEEIALSIIAEIKCCFSGREGKALKWREGTIY